MDSFTDSTIKGDEMDTLEYIKKFNKFENDSRKSVKKIVVGHDAKGDKMRILIESELYDNIDLGDLANNEPDKYHLLQTVMIDDCEIRSDFAGNLFYNDGVSTKPLGIKIEELKNEVDNMRDEVKK